MKSLSLYTARLMRTFVSLLLFAGCVTTATVHAADFSAKFLGDYGNATVMEASGNFDELLPDGTENYVARQNVAKEFFRTHKDEYDSVVIFTNFDYAMKPDGRIAFYQSVKNDVSGIGQEIFDNSAAYGSNGKLHGTIDMGNLLKLASNPLDPGFDFSTDTLIHETMHRWAAYVKFKNWNGTVSDALLGKDKAHWSFLLDSAGSTLYGNKWRDNGDGTFTSIAVRKYYSPLDLYLMGMLDKSKVPPTLLIDNPAIDPTNMPKIGDTISGTARYVNIDDIVAAEGERSPSAKDSQKQFKTAFIYIVTPGTFKTDDLPALENLRNAYLTRFSILTDGKGLVQVASTPLENLPTNPGVHATATVPRTLPPNINDGLSWLINRQQADGSWTDFALTTERDTAESVSTLQIFPSAQSQFQTGLNWLGANGSTTTDYLARRIEAKVHAGSDSTALVQELLARRNSDGGWGGGRNFVSSPTDTALALKALVAAGYSDQAVTGKAIAYLQTIQNPDGGWSGDTGTSVIQPTAAVLSAYNAYRKSYDLEAGIGKAVMFLAAKQNSDGGFGNSPSTVYDSSLALMALQQLNVEQTSISKGMSYLLGQQAEDGSWNESPFQTALSMRAVWQATVEPDLSIKPEDVAIIPATITAVPTNAVLSATIQNLGRSDVSQAKVSIYDGIVDPDHKLAEQTLAFPGSTSVTATFSIPVTSATGHIYHVVVDPENQVKESNKINNRTYKSLQPEITYDFQVLGSDITVSPNPVNAGNDVKIAVKVSNRGTSDAYNVPVRIFIDQPVSPVEIAQVMVDIPSGGSVSREVIWRASLAGVNLPLTVQIDPSNLFTETNKDNNKAFTTLTVNASTLPNLSVSYKDMVISPNPAREGGNVSISPLVKNDGFSKVENVKVSIYKGLASNGGTLLGTSTIPVIAAGQSVPVTIEWKGIAENGERLISVQVASENSIQEISNDDNFTFTTLDILSLPDLAISDSSIVINPATPKAGDTVSVTVTVQNAGDQEAHDVTVQLKEEGAVIGSTVIPLINGNSQASGTINYSNSTQTGSHRVTVVVDPDNVVVESSKNNNSAVKTFTIQDANLWLSEAYISPNGDGIKDSTNFSFRLTAPIKVSVQVVNKKGVAVRTFSGGELDSTTGTTITWDGKNDAGSVVDDGTYQIKVIGANSALLASLPVEVDTNRSPLTEAIGTTYILSNNLTCQLPDSEISNSNWLSHDSGILFDNPYTQQGFVPGTYQMSPLGDDVWKITPDYENNDTIHNYTNSYLSPDGSRFAFILNKYNSSNGQSTSSLWIQNADGQGLRRLVEDAEGISEITWSPDGKKISYVVVPASGSWNHTLYIIDADSGVTNQVYGVGIYTWNSTWSPDSKSLAFVTNTQCNTSCVQTKPTLMLYNLNGDKKVVYVSPDTNDFSIFWLADGKLLLEKGWSPRHLLIVDSINPGDPIEIAAVSENETINSEYSVSPNGRNIAFINSFGSLPEKVSQSVKMAGLNGSTISIGDIGIGLLSSSSHCEGDCLNTPAMLWSKDGSKLAYVETKYREADNQIDENLSVYDLATGLVNSSKLSVLNSLTNDNPYYNNVANTPRLVKRLVDWLEDENSILLDTAEGAFSLNTANGSRSSSLPILGDYNNLTFSREKKYLTFDTYGEPNVACFNQSWSNTWALNSLLNLAADLRITKYKSVVRLKGIAFDKNFAGYKLEYADIKTPDTWNLVMPPSDVPVVNELFIDWVPPGEGSFLIRLTVSDKAGNTAVTRQRVVWGLSSSISNLYLSRGMFSPNKDTVELNYRVVEPVHLEFLVVDSKAAVVRTFVREHPEQVTTSIMWDGRDDKGSIVADGKYTIRVFDYEFPVEIDTTLPDVALTLGSPWRWWKFLMSGHAVDKNMKEWVIEFGEGDNPTEWHEFRKGQDNLAKTDKDGLPILTPSIVDINLDSNSINSTGRIEWSIDRIVEKTGMRFRITATDFVGNSSSRMTEVMPEVLVINQFDDRGVSDSLYLENTPKGLHSLGLYETIRTPLKSMRFQYNLKEFDTVSIPSITKYTWVDSEAVIVGQSARMSIAWNSSGIPANAVAMRLVAITEYGQEYFSNEISFPSIHSSGGPRPPVGCQLKFGVRYIESDCNQISGKVNYELYSPPCNSHPMSITKVKMNLVKPDGSVQFLKTYEASAVSEDLDTTVYPEGMYRLSADVDYIDIDTETPRKTTLVVGLLVDRVLPKGSFLAPEIGEMVCPVTVGETLKEEYVVSVDGKTSDNYDPKLFRLEYGIGNNPDQWLSAMKPGDKGYDQIIGFGPTNGRLGNWVVTPLLGKTVSTKLRVTDSAGNTTCVNRSFSIRSKPELKQIESDKRIFSSLKDILNISYVINDNLTVSANVYQPNIQGELIFVTTIFSGLQKSSGLQAFEWDGRDASGTLLSDGAYTIGITVKSACGIIVSDSSLSVVIDNTAPDSVFIYPIKGDPIPQGNIIEVIGTSSDMHFSSYTLEAGEGENPEIWITLQSGQTPVSNNVLSVWNRYGLQGIWTLRLRTTDVVGNESSVTSVFDLGIRKELIKNLSATPKLFSPNNDKKLDTTNIIFELTDACNIKIDIFDQNKKIVKSFIKVSNGSDNIVWNGKNDFGSFVLDGVYTIQFAASLVANPQITQSETLTLTVDTTSPALTITSPAEKAYLSTSDISVIGTVDDLNLTGYNVTFTGPSGTTTLDSGVQKRTNYTFGGVNALAEETYAITVDANDQGENFSKLVRTFTIDRTPPKVTLDTPNSGEYFGGAKGVIDISGNIVEKNLERYNLRYGLGETPNAWQEVVGGETVPPVSKLNSWNVGKDRGIADGVYTISLYAKDKAGLEGEVKVKVVVDNTLPEVAITQPINGGYLTKATDIKGTLNDTNLDKGLLELAEGDCATATKWSVFKAINISVQNGVLDTWKILPNDGDYCLRLSAIDKSGNKAETKIGFKIDTHPPTPPQLSGKTENKTTGSLSWVKSPEPDVAGYNVYRSGQKLNTAPITTELVYLDTDLKEGSYIYTIKAMDQAGNESASSNTVTLKISLTGPEVRISTPRDGAIVSNLIDIKGTAFSQDNFKEYRVYIGQGSSPSSWSLIRRSPLPTTYGSLAQWDTITALEGSQYTIKLEAEDTSANISTAQTVVTIDNTPPNTPVLLTKTATGADVALTWRGNTETDLAGYLLYRNEQLANVSGIVSGNLKPYLMSGTTYADKSLADGTYRYYLVAMDQAGNSSDQSNTLEVTIDTHPPHMTFITPTNGQKFDGVLMINAESPDNDIATVQFQYKRSIDVGWTNLGTAVANPPYITYFNPKSLGLAYDDFQIQALAVDKGGKPDPAPPLVTITYADLTPPDVPSGLAAKVFGAEVNLTWDAVSEAEVSYNIYRWNAASRAKINGAAVKTLSFTDSAVPDGTYQYEVTATDVSGNESAASKQVTAKIFTPIIAQPFTPVKEPALNLTGKGVDPNAVVEITTVLPSGDTTKVMVTADDLGNFKLEGITLGLGETSFTAVTTDSNGNISKLSETVYVAYGKDPAVPTGLVSSTQGSDVTLNWNANSEPNILGYYIFRDGVRLNDEYWAEPYQVSASIEDTPASDANDDSSYSYWSNPYSSDGKFSPVWWQMTLPEPELINELDLAWITESDYNGNQILYAGKDFEVQAWSGHNWITIKKVTGNDQQYNELTIDPPYRTDRLRLFISATTDPNYSKQVKLAEASAYADDINSSPTYLDVDVNDGKYRYEVSVINQYAFVSGKAATDAKVGPFPQTPTGLTATAQGSDVVLNWNPNSASDSVSYYNLERWNGEVLENSWWVNADPTTYTDSGIANGTYRYRISAMALGNNGWLESDFSDYASATLAIVPPVAPSGLVVTAPAAGKILDIAWQQVSNASGYNLYRSNTQGGPYTAVDRWIDSPAYRDGGLVDGANYYYVVTALDMAGNESGYSTEATGVPRDLFVQQPHIFKPTLPGMTVTTNDDAAEVAGFAESGSHVDIKRNEATIATATASVLEQRLDKALSLDTRSVSLSPDRGLLASVANNKCTLTDLSNNAVTVTLDLPFAESGGAPLWSPSGRYLLLFGVDADWEDKTAIYDRETTRMQLVSTGVTVSEYDASWSPSSDSFVFIGNDINYHRSLWFGTPADGSVVRLADVGDVYDPKLSSDNSRIVFFDSDDALFLLNRNDGTVTMIDADTDGNSSAWSPDGSKFAFISYRDGDGDIYSYSVSSGEITRRTFSQQDGRRLTWSPDGSYVGYRSYDADDNQIFIVVDADGNEKVIFTASDYMYGSPEWRSNGDIIIIEQLGLYTIKPAGYFSTTVNLVAGENRLTAIATDPAGNVSIPSEAITLVYDSGTLPDLAITDSDIILYPPVSKPGEETVVTVRVHNLAGNAVNNVKVDLYLWDGASDVTTLASETISHIDAYGEESIAVRFNVGTANGTRTVIAVADPSDTINEVLETNNYASKDLVITNLEGVRLDSSLNSLKYASNQELSARISLVNSGLPTSGILMVNIEDTSGSVVKQLAGQSLELAYGRQESLPFTWNSGVTFAGNYRLHSLLKNGSTVLAEDSVAFTIVPDHTFTTRITTDRQQYGANQPVAISANFTNAGLNYLIPQLKAKVRILDAQNTQLFSGEQSAVNIMPGMSVAQNFIWNSGLNAPGNFTAKVEYFVGDQVIGSATTTFSIIPVVSITGSLKSTVAIVQPGEAIAITYTLNNNGNSSAAGQALLALVDLDSLSAIATMEQAVSIPMGGTQSGSTVFASDNLLLKPYLVTLTYVSPGSRTSVGTVPVSIKDSIPPVLTVVSPASGEQFAGDVRFSVLASDNASGVARVEYSRDGGTWSQLPPTDLAAGRYGFAWTPVATESGTHSVSFRSTDRAGNTSSPFSVTYIVRSGDTTPPVLIVSTLADGEKTNNQILNIAGSVSDDTGVKQLTVNDAIVAINSDGSFSYALPLISGDNRVEVKASDMAGNQASDVRTIILDQQAPLITILAPADNIKTGTALMVVNGIVDETSTVSVKVGGLPQSTVMNGNGFLSTITLVPGINTIEVTATDLVNNQSTLKRTVIYDDQKPSVAITEPGQDVRTNKGIATIRGTVSDPYTEVSVEVSVDGQIFNPPVIDGRFEQAVRFIAEKSYSIVATATNEVGSTGSTQRNIIYDITPPIIGIDPVASPTSLSSQTISGVMEEGATVVVSCTTATVGAVEYPTTTTWRASLNGIVAANNTIIATANDTADNFVAATASIVYDTTPPTGSILINGGASVSNSIQVALTLAASDASGVSKMRFSNEESVWSEPENYATTRNWILSAGDSVKKVFVSYLDLAGNWSAPFEADILLDTTSPVVSAIPAGGLYNSSQTVRLIGNEPSVIYYTTDGSLPTATSVIYSQPISISSGITLRYRSIDVAGNISDVKTEIYNIDTVPPTLAVSSLSDGSYTNNQVLNVAGTVTDSSGIKTVVINGVDTAFNQNGSFSQAVVLLPGSNVVNTVATDLAGNSSTDSRNINLDMAAPLLTVTAPADNSKTGIQLLTLTGTVNETSTVTLKMDGNTQIANMNGTSFSASLNLVPGFNTIEVIATDQAGNTSSQKRTVVYDDQTPSLAITVPNHDMRTNQATLLLKGTTTDVYTAVMVSITMDGQTFTPPVVAGQFEQLVSFSTEKSHAIVATATNEVGKSATIQRNVIYDITSPALTINPVTAPVPLTDQTITGTRESGLSVTVTCPTATVGTVSYPTDTTWSVVLAGLTAGDNTISVNSVDLAGNSATVSTKITVATPILNIFSYAVFANKSVTIVGSSYLDSYVGSPSSYVTGKYKHGNVGVNSTQLCGIRLTGGTTVYGSASVGVGGSPSTTVCTTIGTSVTGGISALAASKDLTPVAAPTGYTSLGVLNLSGVATKVLTTGTYRYSSINLTGSGKLTTSGQVTLIVDGNVSVSGAATLAIQSGSVVIYVNGAKLDIGGGAFVNLTQNPSNLVIYGSAALTTVNLSGGISLHGFIHAPTAAVKITGSQQTFGAIVGNTVDLSGATSVHYPEGL